MRAALSHLWSPLTRGVLALALLLSVAGCGSGPRAGSVTIMVPWSGDEFAAFHAVVQEFEQDTGVEVHVQITRALTQQLDAAVGAGAPPDLAILPSVGAIYTYAHAAHGKGLKPLDTGTDDFLQPFKGLTTVGNKVYALPVKADVKSLVWYESSPGRRPPDLARLTAPASGRDTWCLGLESGPTSGWPGADWIADLVLAEGGIDAYKGWLSGRWESPEVARAWRDWRKQVGDSVKDATTRPFGEAAEGMTTEPATCSFAHGALSATGFPADEVRRGRYDFVASSGTKRLEVSADFVGKFTTGNPHADALAAYLAGSKAQQSWVNEPGGYAFSANTKVTRYPGEVRQRMANLLRPGSDRTLCFGAADAMAPDMSAAFYRAVLLYASQEDTDPSILLDRLDQLQRKLRESGKSPVPSDRLCTAP